MSWPVRAHHLDCAYRAHAGAATSKSRQTGHPVPEVCEEGEHPKVVDDLDGGTEGRRNFTLRNVRELCNPNHQRNTLTFMLMWKQGLSGLGKLAGNPGQLLGRPSITTTVSWRTFAC